MTGKLERLGHRDLKRSLLKVRSSSPVLTSPSTHLKSIHLRGRKLFGYINSNGKEGC